MVDENYLIALRDQHKGKMVRLCIERGSESVSGKHGETLSKYTTEGQWLKNSSGYDKDTASGVTCKNANIYEQNYSRNNVLPPASCIAQRSNIKVFLILLAVLPSLAKGPDGSHFNRVVGQAGDGLGGDNIFRQKNHSDVTAQAGATAALPCRLSSSLADGMVSWVRRRDYHLLTVGRQVYSSDSRVGVKVSPDGCDWTLTVRWVSTNDAGMYECQVSSHPPQALMINLSVVEAHAEILGGTERFIHSGSSLMLVCLLKGATEPPTFVFWYRGDRMINYDKERGVTVDNTKKFSKLYVSSVSRDDEGNYTCLPSNASPASVSVTVVQRENPAGLQQETNTEKEVSSASSSSSSSPVSSTTNNTSGTAKAYGPAAPTVIFGAFTNILLLWHMSEPVFTR